jgi:hypothetical protein
MNSSGLLALAMAVSSAALPAGDSPQEFKTQWINRSVVLKQPLYTVLYSAPRVASATLESRSTGITVISPHKGTYYYAEPVGTDMRRTPLSDSSPERLQEKISALTENQRVRGLSGRTQNVTASPARLLTYDKSSALVIRDVVVTDKWVRLDLYDLLTDRRQPPTTTLLVEWPQRFSKPFSEQSEIEQLLMEFLEPTAATASALEETI